MGQVTVILCDSELPRFEDFLVFMRSEYLVTIGCDNIFLHPSNPIFLLYNKKVFLENFLLYWECVATRNASKTVNDSSCRALQVNWLQVSIRVGKKICKKTKITKIQFQLKNLFLNKQSHNFGKNISKIPWNWFDLFSKSFFWQALFAIF